MAEVEEIVDPIRVDADGAIMGGRRRRRLLGGGRRGGEGLVPGGRGLQGVMLRRRQEVVVATGAALTAPKWWGHDGHRIPAVRSCGEVGIWRVGTEEDKEAVLEGRAKGRVRR